MRKLSFKIIGFLIVWNQFTHFRSVAQENDSIPTTTITLKQVVVTGTRFEISVDKSGKSIYKLTPEDLSRNAGKSIVDILNEVPGIQMEGNFTSPGTNIGLYVRGSRNKNTLILIDGIPLNDPSGINASYDLRFLPLSYVQSIEVLRGGLSTLYGSGASASVINITLKTALDNTFSGSATISYGSYDTFIGALDLQGTSDKFSYFIAGNYHISEGFSAAEDPQSTGLFDKDGLDQANVLLKLGYKIREFIACTL